MLQPISFRGGPVARVTGATWLLLGLGAPVALQAQAVRGQVIDSVTGNPLAGASVGIIDSIDALIASSLTDSSGLFFLHINSPGQYNLHVSFPGYQSSTFPPFSLEPQEVRAFMLLVPSLDPVEQAEGLYSQVCAVDSEEANLVGWVRAAGTRVPIGNAAVKFSWGNTPDFLSNAVDVGDFAAETRSDSSGLYHICGLPRDRWIYLHAVTDTASSNFVSLMFGRAGVTIGNTSFDMPDGFWRHDLLVVPDVQRTTTLQGVVTLAQTGPASGATVEIVGSRYVTQTDSLGRFEFSNVPAGDVKLRVKKIGTGQIAQEIHVPQAGTVEIPPGMLVLGSVIELDPLVVEAAPPHDALAEFKIRRARGQGSFITREEFSKQGVPATAVDVLRRMQGIRIYPGRDFERRWVIMMQRGGARTFGLARESEPEFEGASPCPPLVFLDRHYIGHVNNIGLDGAIPLETIEAVEAHQSAATLPMEFRRPGSNCGVLAFWTRFAQPRPVPLPTEVNAKKSLWDSTAFHLLLAAGAVVGFFFAVGKTIHF